MSLANRPPGTKIALPRMRDDKALTARQQRITLNLAVGGLFFPSLDPTMIQPGTLQADWVRVFVKP